MQAVAQHLVHGGRIEEGHHHLDERELVGGGRVGRSEGVIVADHDEHPAVAGAPRHVPVADRVHAPVEPRTLPVPERKHPVVPAVAELRRLLAAPDRGRRKVLVDRGLEVDARAREETVGGPQLLVDVVHRRATVTGDVARGVEPRRAVADELHHREAHDRLAAGDVDPSLAALVLVVKGYRGKLHGQSPVAENGRPRPGEGSRGVSPSLRIRSPSSRPAPSLTRIGAPHLPPGGPASGKTTRLDPEGCIPNLRQIPPAFRPGASPPMVMDPVFRKAGRPRTRAPPARRRTRRGCTRRPAISAHFRGARSTPRRPSGILRSHGRP